MIGMSNGGLTRFEVDILSVLAADDPKIGRSIQRDIEAHYETEINHGRLYPVLDQLDQEGLIRKMPGPDKRSNHYALTNRGIRVLEDRYTFIRSNVEARFDIRRKSDGSYGFREV